MVTAMANVRSRAFSALLQTSPAAKSKLYGKTAQAHPTAIPVRAPKALRPMELRGRHVSAAKRQFRERIT
jgi:hypothetical protein